MREGTREMSELRCVEVCLGSRRRRRSRALSNWSTSAILFAGREVELWKHNRGVRGVDVEHLSDWDYG